MRTQPGELAHLVKHFKIVQKKKYKISEILVEVTKKIIKTKIDLKDSINVVACCRLRNKYMWPSTIKFKDLDQ